MDRVHNISNPIELSCFPASKEAVESTRGIEIRPIRVGEGFRLGECESTILGNTKPLVGRIVLVLGDTKDHEHAPRVGIEPENIHFELHERLKVLGSDGVFDRSDPCEFHPFMLH